jgi:ABC-type transporter Mla subunit MlaD
MRREFEKDVILVLIILLGLGGAWIGIQVARDSRGSWSEAAELRFTTSDLQGLEARSEVLCAGAVIGHVRSVTPGLNQEGKPSFTLTAGVKREYAAWKFKRAGLIQVGLVATVFSPSNILLEVSGASDAVQAREPRQGASLDGVKLAREGSEIDPSEILKQFTEPQNGNKLSVIEQIQDFANSLPHASSALRDLNDITASLNGQPHATEAEANNPRPIDRLLRNLETTTGNLSAASESLNKTMGEDGDLKKTLATLNASLGNIQKMSAETAKVVSEFHLTLGKSMRKIDGLLNETNDTMVTLHSKADGLGDTFVGRMLIKKPGATPSPASSKTQRRTP